MADLKTNYVDDVLDTTKNQLRKYQQIQNDDRTVSFVDVTEYTQVGTPFGAKDINDTNAAINDVNGNLKNTSKLFVPFVNKKSVYFYYTDKAYGYGTFLAMDNYGVLDFYILRNVFDNVTSSGVQVLPSKSLGTNSSVAYIHYRNGKYDFQIVFTSEYSHGMVVVGGGSIMNYSEILQE